jgi:glycosyltransferase involved in cell wall biosynthesis
VRTVAQVIGDTADIRRWRRIEQRIVRQSASVIVCSSLDGDRLGAANVRVVPNAYERLAGVVPATARPDDAVRSAPVLLMVGLLTYEANRDAAAFFAREVLPLIRRRHPEAVFRVVGRYDVEANVAAFRSLPGVSVAGEIPDITAELQGADVSVVPIRFGGGTRIKILEAFAHGIPVVATTVGAEGLEVESDRHLLLADGAEDLAQACLRVLDDTELRSRLASEAMALWEARYRSAALQEAVSAAVHEAAGS